MLAELPPFLQLDQDSSQRFEHLDKEQPHIVQHRWFLNLSIQSRRSKFHLPFLLRASHDPRYAFSREACLRAARTVIQIKKNLASERSKDTGPVGNTKLCGIFYLFFFATTVLVMDLCVNRVSLDQVARKEEIQEACKVLEQAKQQSAMAGMFLDSLTAIMRKHRIRLQHQEQSGEEGGGSVVPHGAQVDAPASTTASSAPIFANQSLDHLDFDELWESYIDLDWTVDPHSWNALVSDMEASVH